MEKGNSKEYKTYEYWKYEYNASLGRGRYPLVPIRCYEGEKMIKYLRHINEKNIMVIISMYVRNAIQKKLRQYEDVQWFYNAPTRKPKRTFDYHKKMFKYMYEKGKPI